MDPGTLIIVVLIICFLWGSFGHTNQWPVYISGGPLGLVLIIILILLLMGRLHG